MTATVLKPKRIIDDRVPKGTDCLQARWADEPDRWRDWAPLMPVLGPTTTHETQLLAVKAQYASYRIPGSERSKLRPHGHPGGIGFVFRIGPSNGHPCMANCAPRAL